MNTVLAYTLLLAGLPMFVGMFVGSFIAVPISKIWRKAPKLQRPQLRVLEVVSGLAAAVCGTFLFRILDLTPGLIAPVVLAAWISCYCSVCHRSIPEWLNWLGGLALGWLLFAHS